MNHPLRCRCGALEGHVLPSRSATHAVCYCRDCQAYARFLGQAGIVDEDGGTEVVAMLPARVQLTRGLTHLACLSLSERGLLRWYARCCATPIANTPRNPRVPYAGVVHSCLGDAAAIRSTFGALRIAVNTKSARHAVRSTPAATLIGVLGLAAALLGARLSGSYRRNPFFEASSGAPIKPVRVLTPDERATA
jgi:hypothetical protein